MAEMMITKCDSASTSDACGKSSLSRENSISSLPETECEWREAECGWLEPSDSVKTTGTPTVFLSTPSPAGPPGRLLPSEGAALGPASKRTSVFRVTYPGGVEIRSGPFNAPKTGQFLKPGDVFVVIEEVQGNDGILYLCLADGLGWVFDDGKLLPQDPSVVRCSYTEAQGSGGFPHQTQSQSWPPPLGDSEPTVGRLLSSLPTVPAPTVPPSRIEILSSTPLQIAAPVLVPPAPVHSPQLAPQPVARPPPVSWFRVSVVDGLPLHVAPSLRAPLAGVILPFNETFPVAEEVSSPDGRVYLRLCDGQGWACDNTAVMPHNPTVKRGNWVSSQSVGWQFCFTPDAGSGYSLPAQHNGRRRMYPQPRGKRGGKRCSKRKQSAAAAGAGVTA